MVAKFNSKTHLQKRFSFFQPSRPRLSSKFVESAILKNKFKNAIWVSKKPAEFDADFESVKR
jgi:hypothetical protein